MSVLDVFVGDSCEFGRGTTRAKTFLEKEVNGNRTPPEPFYLPPQNNGSKAPRRFVCQQCCQVLSEHDHKVISALHTAYPGLLRAPYCLEHTSMFSSDVLLLLSGRCRTLEDARRLTCSFTEEGWLDLLESSHAL